MNRHVQTEMVGDRGQGSYQTGGLPDISSAQSHTPSPGVDVRERSQSGGIPFGEMAALDIREFVAEAALRRFVMDDRPRSRRAAAAVLLRFAQRHKLQIFRLGRTRLYRVDDFFRALARESQVRADRILRRAAQ